MKRFPLLPLTLAILTSGLVSCTSVKTAMAKVATPVRTAVGKVSTPVKTAVGKVKTPVKTAVGKVTTPVKSSFAKIPPTKFTFPSFRKKTPPIIEVKNPDADKLAKISKTKASNAKALKAKALKAKKAKADAIAWNRKKKASAKKTYRKPTPKEKALVPKDFEASDLEVDGQIPSFGILPSLKPGGMTSIDDLDEGAALPADVVNLPPIPNTRPAKKAPDLSTVPDYLKPVGPVPSIKTGR